LNGPVATGAIALCRARGFEPVGELEEQAGSITVPVPEMAAALG
jgi:hypothetical protein